MTTHDLTKLAAAHAASTPGPWLDAVSDTHEKWMAVWADGGMAGVAQIAILPTEFASQKANAAFIALAHQHVPALLAQLQAQTAALAWYADTFCELGKYHEDCGKYEHDYCAGCKARSLVKGQP